MRSTSLVALFLRSSRSSMLAAMVAAMTAAGCAAESSEDPSADSPAEGSGAEATDVASEELTAKPTFATVGPIVQATCGGCHAQFQGLAGIKADKAAMIAKISAGSMPKGNPTWKTTADGKKVLKWLKTGADLK